MVKLFYGGIIMENKDPLELAQLIVRGSFINFNYKEAYSKTSSIYKFSNENISAYFNHLQNKEKVLTVIGSGGQILNGVLAGTRDFDCFDISMFPEYYLNLQLASVVALTKEEYLEYYFSEDREILFCDEFYDKISEKLKGKYKNFWDTLYMFDEGIDIYNSLLFKHDLCFKKTALENNPYLQEKNFEKLKSILETEYIKINPKVADITKVNFPLKYDLINLSNILSYCFKSLEEYIFFLDNNFLLKENGEIINYFFHMDKETESKVKKLLHQNGYIEDINEQKLLVYKK